MCRYLHREDDDTQMMTFLIRTKLLIRVNMHPTNEKSIYEQFLLYTDSSENCL